MRPAYVVALAAAAIATVLGLVWGLRAPPPAAEAEKPAAIVPEQIDQGELLPVDQPVVGTPTEAQRRELLDRLEELEQRRFGPTEATRRRELREQMLDARTGR